MIVLSSAMVAFLLLGADDGSGGTSVSVMTSDSGGEVAVVDDDAPVMFMIKFDDVGDCVGCCVRSINTDNDDGSSSDELILTTDVDDVVVDDGIEVVTPSSAGTSAGTSSSEVEEGP